MTFIKQLVDDLRDLGVRENSVLLVHSSLRSLGTLEGGAETVIRSLLDVLGEDGTLLMPALSFRDVTVDHPYFNVCKTPSCVGALPEYFRQQLGTQRSLHPTHSVSAIGKLASELLNGHENDSTPCGKNSPFHKLPKYHGQILFLGCGLLPNTSMHAIEELSEPPYLYDDLQDYEMTNANQEVFTMTVRSHNFEGYAQRYDRLAQVLGGQALRTGKILGAECHLVESSAMWSVVHDRLKQDPLYFVDRIDDGNSE